ncbi:hypothetical protein CCHR01_14472 [Colletotrichum chrysophilum]|uniref:Uncharacterized protein n=1 Tax=Colletotrichum chrysophilum TaxID=1836956 RepID=A0AAD9A7H6_9PEZI|nr:hypothetical protein CCHR01_14472 [Colletotrichum chrysophilum]
MALAASVTVSARSNDSAKTEPETGTSQRKDGEGEGLDDMSQSIVFRPSPVRPQIDLMPVPGRHCAAPTHSHARLSMFPVHYPSFAQPSRQRPVMMLFALQH